MVEFMRKVLLLHLLFLFFFFCSSLLLIAPNDFELQGFYINGCPHSAEFKILFTMNTEGQHVQHQNHLGGLFYSSSSYINMWKTLLHVLKHLRKERGVRSYRKGDLTGKKKQ